MCYSALVYVRLLIASIFMMLCTVVSYAESNVALVNLSTAHLRAKPSHASEMVSQLLMGMPVKVLSRNNGWLHVKTIDGYDGFVKDNSLVILSDEEYDSWKRSPRVIYSAYRACELTDSVGEAVTDIVPGSILEVKSSVNDSIHMKLPDGRLVIGATTDFTDLDSWARQSFDPDKICVYARANMGVPYLWGGLSSKGMDCSGLTWTALFLNGRILPRDASKQALINHNKIGEKTDIRFGNLVFFGNPATGKINHVGIAEDNRGNLLHCSGRVKRNSIYKGKADSIDNDFIYGIDISSSDVLPAVVETDLYDWFFAKCLEM